MKGFRILTFCLVAMAMSTGVTATASTKTKSIVKVEAVSVETAPGYAPVLPFQVWVDYSDGTGELRQIRWSNSGSATEKMQASDDPAVNPIGRTYTVSGFITGDNTTAAGYPVSATVKVTEKGRAVPSSKTVAEPLPLGKVRITGDNRLTSNRDLDMRQILGWDVKQQLYNFRDTYGLSTEGYPVADGWDSPTTKLKGHGSGHYMSALAFAYASATDPEVKAQLMDRISLMVNQLREMQEMTFVWDEGLGRYREARDYAPEEEIMSMGGSWEDFDEYKKDVKNYGYGYINAIPPAHCVLIERYAPYNNQIGVWAPYYTVHKILAGLIDISLNVEDKAVADKALLIAKDMGLWVWNRMHYRTYVKSDGEQAERRAKPGNRYEMWNMYIAGEVGGISESLARLSGMVSDPVEKARLLEASNYFDSPALYDPLSRNIDDIRTRHANQHIPMIVGALRSYRENSNPYYYNIAFNFWNFVQGRYRYAMGGVGIGEMFRQPYAQMTTMATASQADWRTGEIVPLTEINETCCAYNLAKLSKDLNCFDPDDARYMDYYERVLYNQIVGSVHPHDYAVTYQYSVGLNSSKPWGNVTPQESCCGGTGSENHVKYQEAAYFVNDNTMWVALYMPTEARWDAKGVTLEQSCEWPSEHSVIRVKEGKAKFALKLRVPYWATEGFDVRLNGKSVASEYTPCSYVEIPERKWSGKDVVEVIMPFTRHLDFGPDKMSSAVSASKGKYEMEPMWLGTVMYGPLVMATTGIEEWEDATVSLNSDLSEITLCGASKDRGTDGNLYTVKMGGRTFVPDYYADEHATRYFRINLIGDPSAAEKMKVRSQIEKTGAFDAKNYSSASYAALNKAIAEAEALCGRDVLGADEAAKGIEAIDRAIKALKSAGVADRSMLEAAVRKAGNIDSKAYTDMSIKALEEVRAESEKVLGSNAGQLEVDLQTYALNSAISHLEDAAGVEKGELREMLYTARDRRDRQERWLGLEVKVPEFAPWAPNGYRRLMEKYDQANAVLNGNGRNYSQEEVNAMVASLNEAINNMRPGNLPEIEDLAELNRMLVKAKDIKDDAAVKEAVAYAEMVVAYVTDGSGTKDMIERAESQLKAVLR